MNISRPVRLSLLLASTLGILAACDVSDSPERADAPTTTTFAPRILAPAGGVRQADWLHLQIWKQNGQTGQWDSLHSESDLPPTRATLQVKVPLRQKLRYRVAGYVVSFPNGTRQVDTVWSAEETDFILYDTVAVQRNSGTVAKNWAVTPIAQTATSATLKPGSAVDFRAASGQFVVVGSDSNLSCGGATDSLVRITALLANPLTAWVRACGDGTTLPSSPRKYSWTNDTTGISGQRTPLSPSPTGATGFLDFGRLLTAEIDPSATATFSVSEADDLIAWAVRVFDKDVVFDTTNFPRAPDTKALAPHSNTTGALDIWSVVKDSLPRFPSGMAILVTAVRIDTGLGVEWPSAPLRFWYNVTPPEPPSRFSVTPQGWDSLLLDWSLSNPSLRYSAWYALGSQTPDSSRSTLIPVAALGSPTWSLSSLPPDTTVTVVVKSTDPRTGLASVVAKQGKTGKLPAIPTPSMTSPNTNPATLKLGSLGDVKVAIPLDTAGRSLKIRYATLIREKSVTPTPGSEAWPDLSSPGVASSLSSDGKLVVSAKAGEYLYISYVAEDDLGRRSPIAGQQLIEVVADDVDVPPPAPTGVRITSRTPSSVMVAWDSMPGFSYLVRWSVNGVRATEQAVDSTRFLISGLPAGTVLDSISVKSIQIGNASKFSGYSTPSLVVRTKSPPAVPTQATSSWVTDGNILKLRLKWSREAGTAELTALEGVSGASTIPSSPKWTASVGSGSGLDSLDVPYTLLGETPYVAFGRRTFRDSIEAGPVWTHVAIHMLAPAVAADSLRIWQFGSLLKVTAPQGPESLGFQLRVQVFQASTSFDSVFTIQRGVGELKLGPNTSGILGARFWWESVTKTGTAKFDKGEDHTRTKNILPTPSAFVLRPGLTDQAWIFTPTDIQSGAQVILVRTRAGGGQVSENVASGSEIKASVANNESFQIAQIVGVDTSDLSPNRSLQALDEPLLSHPEGTYLFPFRVLLTGSTPQVFQNQAWTNAENLFDPFALGTFEARSAAPFGLSPTSKFTFDQDTTFRDRIWDTRVSAAKDGGIGKSWVAFENAEFSYVPTDAAGDPANIKFSQRVTTAPAVVGFTVDAVNGSKLDLSNATSLIMGTTGSSTKIIHTIFLHVQINRVDVRLRLPTVLVGSELRASLLAGTVLPSYTDATGMVTKVEWADLPKLLSSVSAVGLAVSGPSGSLTTAGAAITSVQVIRTKGF